MNIKEIALKVGLQVFEEHPYDDGHVVSPDGYTWIDDKLIEFAEYIISAYKAELLKEVGEPVAVTNHAQLGYVTDGMHPDIPLAMWAKETSYSGANIALYTSDQVAAAIIKATKPLEDSLAVAQEEILIERSNGDHWSDAYSKWVNTDESARRLIELQDQLIKAEQLWQVAQGRCDGLEEKLAKAEQRVAEAIAMMCDEQEATYSKDIRTGDLYKATACEFVAKRVRAGEWRKFLKGE